MLRDATERASADQKQSIKLASELAKARDDRDRLRLELEGTRKDMKAIQTLEADRFAWEKKCKEIEFEFQRVKTKCDESVSEIEDKDKESQRILSELESMRKSLDESTVMCAKEKKEREGLEVELKVKSKTIDKMKADIYLSLIHI